MHNQSEMKTNSAAETTRGKILQGLLQIWEKQGRLGELRRIHDPILQQPNPPPSLGTVPEAELQSSLGTTEISPEDNPGHEYRTDAERFGDLLDKDANGADPDENNLSAEEDAELEELWYSQGFHLEVGPYYRRALKQDEAEDFQTMPLDGGRSFLEQFERRALTDEMCRKWLETKIYPNGELMRDLAPRVIVTAKTTGDSDNSPPAKD